MEYSAEEKHKIERMSPTLRLILKQLEKGIHQIIEGDCDYVEEDKEEILDGISMLISPERPLSKYQVARALRVSEKQVDRYVKDGKLAKPKHQQGFKELGFTRRMVEKAKKSIKRFM